MDFIILKEKFYSFHYLSNDRIEAGDIFALLYIMLYLKKEHPTFLAQLERISFSEGTIQTLPNNCFEGLKNLKEFFKEK